MSPPCRPVRRGLSPPCRPGPWNGWKGVLPSSAGSSIRCGSGSPSWSGLVVPRGRSMPCARSCSIISPRSARAAAMAAGVSAGATVSSGATTSSPSPGAAGSPVSCGSRSVSSCWSTPPSAADTAERQTATGGVPPGASGRPPGLPPDRAGRRPRRTEADPWRAGTAGVGSSPGGAAAEAARRGTGRDHASPGSPTRAPWSSTW